MPIITDGLIGYWHYKQGVSGSTWSNIAPATKGQYNGTINGAVLQSNGMYFDGVDDYMTTSIFPTIPEFTIEFFMEYDDYKNSISAPLGYYLSGNIRGGFDFTASEPWNYIRWMDNTGSFYAPTPYGSVPKNAMVCTSLKVSGRTVEIFVNGILLGKGTTVSVQYFGGSLDMGRRMSGTSASRWFKGIILSARVYNRCLSNEEITQNYTVGTEIGLDDLPPVNEPPPSVTIISQSRHKLSPVPPMNVSTLKFKFDQDVTDWAVMVLGSDYSTGTIAGSGKNVTKDAEIAVDITHQMLYQEGDNRINIYGRNSEGQWTPYD